jgi:hypothetical protein
MILHAAIASELPFLRAEAEALMVDAGTAMRPTGGFVYDAGTDTEVEAADDLFDSPCKVQTRNIQPRESEVGERTAVTYRVELHLPVSSEPLAAGDLFEITAVDDLSLSVVGQRFRVLAPVAGTLKTARRYEVEAA